MGHPVTNPVVHLELHTGDVQQAGAFYSGLFGWLSETIDCPSGSYRAVALGPSLDGGMVQCSSGRPLWLPYVEVSDVSGMTDRARELGAAVTLEPREGPAGWRSVVAATAGGEVALWQPKQRRS